MDFDLSQEQRAIQETARQFAAEKMAPFAAEWDEQCIFPVECLREAAALGFARRAFDEAIGRATSRRMFGQTLADFQLTQSKLAEMATGIDAAALLTYRAAWMRDGGARITKEAAMAKMTATETAQRVIDAAVQMFGGQGVVSGETVERLYREIRALRIYEGATEVQQLIIARELLRSAGAA